MFDCSHPLHVSSKAGDLAKLAPTCRAGAGRGRVRRDRVALEQALSEVGVSALVPQRTCPQDELCRVPNDTNIFYPGTNLTMTMRYRTNPTADRTPITDSCPGEGSDQGRVDLRRGSPPGMADNKTSYAKLLISTIRAAFSE